MDEVNRIGLLKLQIANNLAQSLPRLDMDHIDSLTSSPKWFTPKRYAPSSLMKSRQLGHLDPQLYVNETVEEMYEADADHLGRLWYWLSYREDVEELKLKIIKARNLKNRKEGSGNASGDCFVRIYLQQDDRRVLTTNTQKKTSHPNFDETFLLQVPLDKFPSQTLCLDVYSTDKYKRSKLIGVVRQALCILRPHDSDQRCDELKRNPQSINLSHPANNMSTSHENIHRLNPTSLSVFKSEDSKICYRLYHDLQSPVASETEESPELTVGLTYMKTHERLVVAIFECKPWPKRENGEFFDLYVKVMLFIGIHGKEKKIRKTESENNGIAFDQSVTFSRLTDVNQVFLKISLYQQNSTLGLFDKKIGSVVIGPEMFAKRKGLSHWQRMIKQIDSQVNETHELVPL